MKKTRKKTANSGCAVVVLVGLVLTVAALGPW